MRLGGGEGQGSGGRACSLLRAPRGPGPGPLARSLAPSLAHRGAPGRLGSPLNAARPLGPRSPAAALPAASLAEGWEVTAIVCAARPARASVPGPRGAAPSQRRGGRATAEWRAPRGGKAGVFNGSMLPAAGAAPGQAGPPARPQPPRSHQLQLQLRALRLPASPAALAGNRRPGARTPRLSAFVFSRRDSGHCSGLCRLVCPSLDGQTPFHPGLGSVSPDSATPRPLLACHARGQPQQ